MKGNSWRFHAKKRRVLIITPSCPVFSYFFFLLFFLRSSSLFSFSPPVCLSPPSPSSSFFLLLFHLLTPPQPSTSPPAGSVTVTPHLTDDCAQNKCWSRRHLDRCLVIKGECQHRVLEVKLKLPGSSGSTMMKCEMVRSRKKKNKRL